MPIEPQMKHLNNNALCAMFIEVTGDNPLKCDVVEVVAYLLDNFIQPSNKMPPFYNQVAPFRPETIDYETASIGKEKIINAARHGLEPSQAADRFEEWFNHLDLPHGKKIIPVCYNWPLMSAYLRTWLGYHNFNGMFGEQYRDVMVMAYQINDHRNMLAKECVYPRPDSLAYLCSRHALSMRLSDDCMVKALKIGELYRAMLSNRI